MPEKLVKILFWTIFNLASLLENSAAHYVHAELTTRCWDDIPVLRGAMCRRDFLFRYYFDKTTRTCHLFIWGGCGKSLNNFISQLECQRICHGVKPASVDSQYTFPIPYYKRNRIEWNDSNEVSVKKHGMPMLKVSKSFTKRCGRFFGANFEFYASNGVDMSWKMVPWVVHISWDIFGDSTICSGTLIASQWVLTAASCFKRDDIKQYNRFSVFMTGNVIRNISAIIPHPAYALEADFNYDIALVKLAQPVEKMSRVAPICLPQQCSTNQCNSHEIPSLTSWLPGIDTTSSNCDTVYLTRHSKCSQRSRAVKIAMAGSNRNNSRPYFELSSFQNFNECDVGSALMCKTARDQFALAAIIPKEAMKKSNPSNQIPKLCQAMSWIRQIVFSIDYTDELFRIQTPKSAKRKHPRIIDLF